MHFILNLAAQACLVVSLEWSRIRHGLSSRSSAECSPKSEWTFVACTRIEAVHRACFNAVRDKLHGTVAEKHMRTSIVMTSNGRNPMESDLAQSGSM